MFLVSQHTKTIVTFAQRREYQILLYNPGCWLAAPRVTSGPVQQSLTTAEDPCAVGRVNKLESDQLILLIWIYLY